jgi:hypothetical protein
LQIFARCTPHGLTPVNWHQLATARTLFRVSPSPRIYRNIPEHFYLLRVNHDDTWNVLVRFSLIIIDRNTFKLLVIVANVVTTWTDAVLVRNSLPELGICMTYTDLANSRTVSMKHTDLVDTLNSKV